MERVLCGAADRVGAREVSERSASIRCADEADVMHVDAGGWRLYCDDRYAELRTVTRRTV
jgi:hypothetical protein